MHVKLMGLIRSIPGEVFGMVFEWKYVWWGSSSISTSTFPFNDFLTTPVPISPALRPPPSIRKTGRSRNEEAPNGLGRRT